MTYQKATIKRGGPRFKFIRETIAELKKVVWLSRRELLYLTALVVIVSFAASIVLGIIDYGFAKLIDSVLFGK